MWRGNMVNFMTHANEMVAACRIFISLSVHLLLSVVEYTTNEKSIQSVMLSLSYR